ncbi:MAG: O-antigen ligase family protein [Tepidisphaerales bacterium]
MAAVHTAYLLFALAGLASFAYFRPTTAVLMCVLGGWMLLPNAVYPAPTPQRPADAPLPYWVIGLALPSDLVLTKAWVAPVTALLGLLLADRGRLLRLRPRWFDLPVVLWYLSPMLALLSGKPTSPPALLAVLYLAGSWGVPWLLGRACFASAEGLRQLAGGLVGATLVYLPLAAIETVTGPVAYGWLYGEHPYRLDGSDRYVGHRPIVFFEHGNQYAIWTAAVALAAIALAVSPGRRPWHVAAAALLTVAAVASQSVGAIVLLGAALFVLAVLHVIPPRVFVVVTVGVKLLLIGVYAAALTPLRHTAHELPSVRRAVELLRDAGRHSLAWRLARDEDHLRYAREHPFTGHGRWDWWDRPDAPPARPWGLWQLAFGQYGGPATLAAAAVWLLPPLLTLWRLPRRQRLLSATSPTATAPTGTSPPGSIPTGTPAGDGPTPTELWVLAAAMSLLLLVAAADAVLNSFLPLPLLAAAGAVSGLGTPRSLA